LTREERTEFWRRRLSSYVPGEIGVVEWCRLHGVGIKSFYHWRRILEQPSADEPPTAWLAVTQAEPTAILQPPNSPPSGVTISIGATTIDVRPGFDISTLSAVMRVLQEVSSC
jgi:hypothetical protein